MYDACLLRKCLASLIRRPPDDDTFDGTYFVGRRVILHKQYYGI
jgi:hypothetical protein